MTRIVTLTSGGGGVGTTTVAINLAARLAAAGRRVCLLELIADETAASTRLGVAAISTLSDRLIGASAAPILSLPAGFDLVAGGTEEGWMWGLTPSQLANLAADLRAFGGYDFLLIDAGTGIGQNQLAFSLASPELWLLVTPDSHALSDAYARLKLLVGEGFKGYVEILVNKAENHTIGRYTYDKFREISSFYLHIQPPLAGIFSRLDETATRGVAAADADTHPVSNAELSRMVEHLLSGDAKTRHIDMPTFGRRYLHAAGSAVSEVPDTLTAASFSAPSSADGLQRQFDTLSDQLDALIAEVGQLRRRKGGESAHLIRMPAAAAVREDKGCGQPCIAAMACDSEQVTVQGETFAVYHLLKADGGAQRFAFHSIDDDLEEPEPQKHLS